MKKRTRLDMALENYRAIVLSLKCERTQTLERYYLIKFEQFCGKEKIKYINDLKLMHLEKFRMTLLTTMNEITANRVFCVIKHFLNKCLQWELIEKSPAQHLKRLPEEPSRKIHTWTKTDFKTIKNNVPDWMKGVLLAMWYTGLRPSMIARLKFSDIDFERNYLSTSSTKGGRLKKHEIPFSGQFRDLVLQKLKETKSSRDANKLIFTDASGKEFDRTLITKRISILRNRFSLKSVTLYSIRHTFASDLCNIGVDIKSVSALMTHSKLSTTEKYLHRKEKTLFDSLTKLKSKRAL